MSAEQTPGEQRTEARAEEAAAIRRRWLSLGETLAVLAVMISALTLWLNWAEQSDTRQEKAAETSHAARQAATLTLTSTISGKGSRLELHPASAAQQVLGQTIRFPAALGVDPVDTSGEPRIEAQWFEAALKKARNKAGLPDDSRGDERLPLIIATRFMADGQAREDMALYDLGYTIRGRLLSGHVLALRGLSLVRHVEPGKANAALTVRTAHLLHSAAK